MTAIATLSSDFRISIPDEIRSAHGWEAGTTLAIIPKGSGVLLMSTAERDSLAGIAEGADASDYRDRNDRA